MAHVRLRMLVALSLLLPVVACGCGDAVPTAPGEPAAIEVSPPALSIPQRGVAQLTVKVFDANGAELADQPLVFRSDSVNLVTVSSGGRVVSVGPAGSTLVTIASGSLHASVSVAVTQAPTSLRTRSPIVVLAGASLQLSATVLDVLGTPIPDAHVVYSSAAPGLSVSPEGFLTALGQPGTFVVDADAGVLQEKIQVVVPTHPTGNVVATQALSLSPWGVAISSRGVAYVTQPASGGPALLRASLPSFTLTPGPTGLTGGSPLTVAFSSDGALAYVPALSPNTLSIIDVRLNTIVASVGGLSGALYGVLVSRNDSTIYVTADNDLMYVIDVATREVVTTVDLKAVSNQLVLHPTLPHILASSFNGAKVLEIDEATHAVLRILPVGGQPQGLAISPDGTEMFVADELGRLVVWDLLSNSLEQEIPVPPGAFGLALTPDAAQIYVAIAGGTNGGVQIYDRRTRAAVGTISTGGSPRRIAFDITGRTAIITNDADRVHFVN